MLWTNFAMTFVSGIRGFNIHITSGMIHILLFAALAAAVLYLVDIQRREATRPVPAAKNIELPRI